MGRAARNNPRGGVGRAKGLGGLEPGGVPWTKPASRGVTHHRGGPSEGKQAEGDNTGRRPPPHRPPQRPPRRGRITPATGTGCGRMPMVNAPQPPAQPTCLAHPATSTRPRPADAFVVQAPATPANLSRDGFPATCTRRRAAFVTQSPRPHRGPTDLALMPWLDARPSAQPQGHPSGCLPHHVVFLILREGLAPQIG
jgi:hypothetical protein